jgi:hypothetical protein
MSFFTRHREDKILRRLEIMASALQLQFQAMSDQVAQTLGVEQSAIVLINGIAAQVSAAVAADEAGDITALPGLVTALQTSAANLSAAVLANPGPGPAPIVVPAPVAVVPAPAAVVPTSTVVDTTPAVS